MQNNFFQAYQRNQVNAQNVALMPVKASTDIEAQRLAAFQYFTNNDLRVELHQTREAVHHEQIDSAIRQEHHGESLQNS